MQKRKNRWYIAVAAVVILAIGSCAGEKGKEQKRSKDD